MNFICREANLIANNLRLFIKCFVNCNSTCNSHTNHWVVTCTEIGWDEYVTCSRCDYTTYEEISSTGIHNYKGVATVPTCTEQGFTTYTCDMCGGSYVDDYVDAAGHTYDDYFDATCNNCDFIREAKKHGDSSGDGVLNNKDYSLLMQYINGWDVEIDDDASDVNADGKINNKDYVLIMRYLNGWNVVLK